MTDGQLEDQAQTRAVSPAALCAESEQGTAELTLAQEVIRRNRDTQAVISSLLRFSLGGVSPAELLGHALDLILSIRWLALGKQGAMFLVEDDPDSLVLAAQSSLADPLLLMCAQVPFGRCICGRAAQEQELQFCDQVDERHEITYEGITPHGHYCVPIVYGGSTLGVMNTYVKPGHVRSETEEQFLLAIADILAGMIVRIRAEQSLVDSNHRLEGALAALKATQQQVIEQERLRALGQMASGIAHDFNNALVPIVAYSEVLLYPDGLEDSDVVRQHLELIARAAGDAASVVRRLREFYRPRKEAENLEPVDVNQLAEQVVSLSQPKWKDQAQAGGVTIRVHLDLQPLPTIAASVSALREALINIVFNAVDAIVQKAEPNGEGDLEIRTRADAEWISLEISDTGAGMAEDARSRCLEPFFTTKDDAGTGLGLAMVYGIVQRHEGTIHIESQPGEGTTFIIRLPVRSPEASGAPPACEPAARTGPLQILVVDDEPVPLEAMATLLRLDGHTVVTAKDGWEALEVFRRGQFSMVMSNMAMPVMNGERLAVAVKEASPDTPVVLVTGFGDIMREPGRPLLGVDWVVSKPSSLAALREAISRAMAR